MQTKRKEETCEEQLRRMCRSIAMGITNPDHDQTAHDWMEGVYDIRYIVDREKRYLGCMLMVAGGGPSIWVNTWTKEVEGYWGGDRVTWSFQDNIGLDDYNEEMYNC
jgi:hypothetical protein